MLTTVAGTLLTRTRTRTRTRTLAIGVGAGVLTVCVPFARRVAHLVEVSSSTDADGTRVYQVRGALCFASSDDLSTQFDDAGDAGQVRIDLSQAQVWDASTVAALDAITHKYGLRGTSVEVVGLAGHSAERYERHSGRLSGAH